MRWGPNPRRKPGNTSSIPFARSFRHSTKSVIIYGAGRSSAEQAWYALRGYMLQEEIMAAEFTNHDIVLKVLHQHLKNNVVTKTQFADEIANLKGLINKDPRKGKDKTTK